jgi:hypothetical protein
MARVNQRNAHTLSTPPTLQASAHVHYTEQGNINIYISSCQLRAGNNEPPQRARNNEE